MSGLTWAVVLGFVGGTISLAFKIPQGLEVFHIFAAASTVGGYVLGEYTNQRIAKKGALIFFVLMALAILFGAGMGYLTLINQGVPGAWIVVTLGALLSVFFFSLAYLMALAGVVIVPLWNK
jgi:hypothetical protein